MQQVITRLLGSVLILLGIAVFLVRLHHAGVYVMPGGGNLLAGALALVLGAWLLSPWAVSPGTGQRLSWLGLAVGPIVSHRASAAGRESKECEKKDRRESA